MATLSLVLKGKPLGNRGKVRLASALWLSLLEM